MGQTQCNSSRCGWCIDDGYGSCGLGTRLVLFLKIVEHGIMVVIVCGVLIVVELDQYIQEVHLLIYIGFLHGLILIGIGVIGDFHYSLNGIFQLGLNGLCLNGFHLIIMI